MPPPHHHDHLLQSWSRCHRNFPSWRNDEHSQKTGGQPFECSEGNRGKEHVPVENRRGRRKTRGHWTSSPSEHHPQNQQTSCHWLWLGRDLNHLQGYWRSYCYWRHDSWSENHGHIWILRYQKFHWRNRSTRSWCDGLCQLNRSYLPQRGLLAPWKSQQKYRRCLFAGLEIQSGGCKGHQKIKLGCFRADSLMQSKSNGRFGCTFSCQYDCRYRQILDPTKIQEQHQASRQNTRLLWSQNGFWASRGMGNWRAHRFLVQNRRKLPRTWCSHGLKTGRSHKRIRNRNAHNKFTLWSHDRK